MEKLNWGFRNPLDSEAAIRMQRLVWALPVFSAWWRTPASPKWSHSSIRYADVFLHWFRETPSLHGSGSAMACAPAGLQRSLLNRLQGMMKPYLYCSRIRSKPRSLQERGPTICRRFTSVRTSSTSACSFVPDPPGLSRFSTHGPLRRLHCAHSSRSSRSLRPETAVRRHLESAS